MPRKLMPIVLALSQLSDPVFSGVLLRSIAWSIACFAAIYAGAIWAVHHLLALHGWLAWTVDILGSLGASLLAFWLFLPVAVGIGTLYVDRIASAVEHRYYPWMHPPKSASMFAQAWDAAVVALKVLALNVAGLILAFIVPGIGFLLGWIIAGYAIGRGLFVGVAMRRMPRASAELMYRRSRGMVLTQGAIVALAAYVPGANLLIAIIGTAAMVHILDMALSADRDGSLKR